MKPPTIAETWAVFAQMVVLDDITIRERALMKLAFASGVSAGTEWDISLDDRAQFIADATEMFDAASDPRNMEPSRN